jgi:hypothetical protein
MPDLRDTLGAITQRFTEGNAEIHRENESSVLPRRNRWDEQRGAVAQRGTEAGIETHREKERERGILSSSPSLCPSVSLCVTLALPARESEGKEG